MGDECPLNRVVMLDVAATLRGRCVFLQIHPENKDLSISEEKQRPKGSGQVLGCE